MHNESKYPTYTVGVVANAIDVPVNTVRTWTQRGYGVAGLKDADDSGQWRRYTAGEVAAFAALARLSAEMPLFEAREAIIEITRGQAADWEKALRDARQRPGNIYILVVKYLNPPDGKEKLKNICFLYCGDNINAVRKQMEEPEEDGYCENDQKKSPIHPVDSSVIVNVGPAVSTALRKLCE
jgi:DNA-binding transcriptional MerR regulator